eukprot:1161355-Pelagomonas_calceolata.AAC.9
MGRLVSQVAQERQARNSECLMYIRRSGISGELPRPIVLLRLCFRIRFVAQRILSFFCFAPESGQLHVAASHSVAQSLHPPCPLVLSLFYLHLWAYCCPGMLPARPVRHI